MIMKLIKDIGLPNISAETVRKFLERRGFSLDLDLRTARLGRLIKGETKLPNEKYRVQIACCAVDGRTWICRADQHIPQNTRYILDCEPRANLVHLWKV